MRDHTIRFLNGAIVTDRQWHAMCGAGLGRPLSLQEADLDRPYCYDREYGFFGVEPAKHWSAQAFLYSLHCGQDGTDWFEFGDKLFPGNLQAVGGLYMAQVPGTAYMSSIYTARPTSGFEGSLRPFELRWFNDVRYLAPNRSEALRAYPLHKLPQDYRTDVHPLGSDRYAD